MSPKLKEPLSPAEALDRAIELAGGSQEKLAARIREAGGNIKQQTISVWRKNGAVPADQALDVARGVDFAVTPHELAPDTYPNPWDGLPVERVASLFVEAAVGGLTATPVDAQPQASAG